MLGRGLSRVGLGGKVQFQASTFLILLGRPLAFEHMFE